MDRREFVGAVALGAGALLTRPTTAAEDLPKSPVDQVKLGQAGTTGSFVGMGTGVHGWMGQSNATRMGVDKLSRIVRHAIERGVTLFDMADLYGVHPLMRQALAGAPRERLTLQSKVWFAARGMPAPTKDAVAAVERFLKELGVEYLDHVLLHTVSSGGWTTDLRPLMDQLETLRQRGLIRAHGLSAHSFAALRAAHESPWVQVQLARINHKRVLMDGDPPAIAAHLKAMRAAGKAVIGMKLFGEGRFKTAEEREASLRWVIEQRCCDAMIVGFEDPAHVDDTLAMVERILKG